LGFLKIRKFLQEGLDMPLSDLPVGQLGSVKITAVVAGLDPAIHLSSRWFLYRWMPESSPGMTTYKC
jgi:hypothetical protein